MSKLWVSIPKKVPVFRVLVVGFSTFIAYQIAAPRCRREFMRRVRVRNELMRLDVATIKEIIDVDLKSADGKALKLEDLKSEYICIYSGSFKDFARIHSNLQETQYSSELGFLFVSDEEKLQRLVKEAVRVPLANS